MSNAIVLFDFDRTLIPGDSDDWVVTQMGLSPLLNRLSSSLPWNSLMDRMMAELHSRGKSADDIVECLKWIPVLPRTISAIKSAHVLRCDLQIVSDANLFFIERILESNGILTCFSQIHSNPAIVDDEGRLRIFPYHNATRQPHGCCFCPAHMCKGLILDQIRASIPPNEPKRFIYLGDGKNDFCPTIRLNQSDFVMPRKNYPLWNRIHGNSELVKAEVHEWTNDVELEMILASLIQRVGSSN